MKTQRIPLARLTRAGVWFEKKTGRLMVGQMWMTYFFEVPESVEQVDMMLSDQEREGAYLVASAGRASVCVWTSEGTPIETSTCATMAARIRDFEGAAGDVYLSIEY